MAKGKTKSSASTAPTKRPYLTVGCRRMRSRLHFIVWSGAAVVLTAVALTVLLQLLEWFFHSDALPTNRAPRHHAKWRFGTRAAGWHVFAERRSEWT